MPTKKGLCWLRRDLRLHDHAALSHCLRENELTYLVFVFDDHILAPLKKKSTFDKRVQFIAESLVEIEQVLRSRGGGLRVCYGDPVVEIPKLIQEWGVDSLYFNRDYTVYPLKRDDAVTAQVREMGASVFTFKDCLIFEPEEILSKDAVPYRKFTAYANRWRARLDEIGPPLTFPVTLSGLAPISKFEPLTSAEKLLRFAGFESESIELPGGSQAGLNRLKQFSSRLSRYAIDREFPATEGSSKLSVYLRHGCISVRDMLNLARSQAGEGPEKWCAELIWREFYQMIFFFFPEVHSLPFQEKYRALRFSTSEDLLAAFKAGKTGFPLIDAAMRCLNQTGWMHNRLRMVTASFLTKILLVDWKRGERYFSWKLLDYDLAANNGGWQWSAGIGCDAAPYFRIFNPTTQSQTYDSNGDFIREFCPELRDLNAKDIHCPSRAKVLPAGFQLGRDYPYPVVDYAVQRTKALAFFGFKD